MESYSAHKPRSAVAKYLALHIDQSEKTQIQIAAESGFPKSNVISMLKSGQTKLPIARIPALARALDACEHELFYLAMREYNPDWLAVIERLFVSKREITHSSGCSTTGR